MWDGYSVAGAETITIDIPGKTCTSSVSGDVSTYLSGDTGSFALDPGANTINVYASDGVTNAVTTVTSLRVNLVSHRTNYRQCYALLPGVTSLPVFHSVSSNPSSSNAQPTERLNGISLWLSAVPSSSDCIYSIYSTVFWRSDTFRSSGKSIPPRLTCTHPTASKSLSVPFLPKTAL